MDKEDATSGWTKHSPVSSETGSPGHQVGTFGAGAWSQ